ncbi:hypothetical protein BGZ65_009663, partial [Modicella reniformis]
MTCPEKNEETSRTGPHSQSPNIASPSTPVNNDRAGACRLFFESSGVPRKATFVGIRRISGQGAAIIPGDIIPGAAIIPDKTPTFKFVARVKDRRVGHYVVRWRVKLLEGFSIPTGLRFSIAVSYDDEPTDMSGSFDVALSPDDLKGL